MRHFEVTADTPHTWPDMPPAARVVTEFLTRVRLTGDPAAAAALMAPTLRAHQVIAEAPTTIERTPAQYAAHVRDMLATFGRFRYTVTAMLVEAEHVFVRWRQDGRHLGVVGGHPPTGAPLSDVGSAVYRVADGRIAEYWIQLDRAGLTHQVASAPAS